MQMQEEFQTYSYPDEKGHFGPYGGVFVSETLIHALEALKTNYEELKHSPEFQEEFHHELKHFVGRPSPVYFAKRLSEQCGGAQIWLKREDLNHTGAHKVNNTVGQALLARHMGKKTHHSRDWSRTARRCICHGCRAIRHGVCRLYGL